MKEMIRTKKFLVITFTCLTITLISASQTRDEIYRKPLKDVLAMVENRYNVKN